MLMSDFEFHVFKQYSDFRSDMLRCINSGPSLQSQNIEMPSKLRTMMDSQECWRIYRKRYLLWKVMLNFVPCFDKYIYKNHCYLPGVAQWWSHVSLYLFRLHSSSGRIQWIQCCFQKGDFKRLKLHTFKV